MNPLYLNSNCQFVIVYTTLYHPPNGKIGAWWILSLYYSTNIYKNRYPVVGFIKIR